MWSNLSKHFYKFALFINVLFLMNQKYLALQPAKCVISPTLAERMEKWLFTKFVNWW